MEINRQLLWWVQTLSDGFWEQWIFIKSGPIKHTLSYNIYSVFSGTIKTHKNKIHNFKQHIFTRQIEFYSWLYKYIKRKYTLKKKFKNTRVITIFSFLIFSRHEQIHQITITNVVKQHLPNNIYKYLISFTINHAFWLLNTISSMNHNFNNNISITIKVNDELPPILEFVARKKQNFIIVFFNSRGIYIFTFICKF